MDKNTAIGIVLIMLLFLLYLRLQKPSEEELAAMERMRDSIAQVDEPLVSQDTASQPKSNLQKVALKSDIQATQDTGIVQKKQVLQNDLIQIEINNKGGVISGVLLKQYEQYIGKTEEKEPVVLLENNRNTFEYLIPANGRITSTADLMFRFISANDNKAVLEAKLTNGGSIRQTYTLLEKDYTLDYKVEFLNCGNDIDRAEEGVAINWINHVQQLERNVQFERMYSALNYKKANDRPRRTKARGNAEKVITDAPILWVSHANQFFNSSLIADNPFTTAVLSSSDAPDTEEDALKLYKSNLALDYGHSSNEVFDFQWYLGPNEFVNLKSFDKGMQHIIPFGYSIFGSINRSIIRPIFTFLGKYIGSAGIVILLLTLIVKASLYPLTYKMLHSQTKMSALKPQMAKMREKYKDDQQKQQMESMKVYREYGVNPAGGCLPMVLQMPIWFALYRFFPASIEFRQKPFLWAQDLSSYDNIIQFPFEIPFLGDHLSLFTLLWALSTLAYTYYNNKVMDMSAMTNNPMMKYMQYFMPLMFIFFFNNYASGLTCYLLFSNLITVGQTIVTKNFLINQDKIKEELELNKSKPKKKSGFQDRLEKAMKEQQKVMADREAKKRRKR